MEPTRPSYPQSAPSGTQPLVRSLLDRELISRREAEILAAANLDSAAALWSLLRAFPSLGHVPGFDLPMVSSRLAGNLGAAAAALAEAPGTAGSPAPPFAFGAAYPGEGPASPGWEVPLPPVGAPIPGDAAAVPPPLASEVALDVRCGPWPVRNQATRGTCVAFATTACCEQLSCPEPPRDLSEQFLYWAIKVQIGDPWPTSDGTLLDYARQALSGEGICLESLWPYSTTVLPGNPGHSGPGQPSAAARADAHARILVAGRYQRGTAAGNAARLVAWLKSTDRAAAVSLPVFHDATVTTSNNWSTPLGWLYGRVLDPPPTAVADGGHAVCVTGFRPDAGEPNGGHFIIRNSWDTQWGSALPDPGYAGPAPGYGQVSATYVEKYLWEMLQL
jgi:Papain family cysteine protease